jgi:hypothetical protein
MALEVIVFGKRNDNAATITDLAGMFPSRSSVAEKQQQA